MSTEVSNSGKSQQSEKNTITNHNSRQKHVACAKRGKTGENQVTLGLASASDWLKNTTSSLIGLISARVFKTVEEHSPAQNRSKHESLFDCQLKTVLSIHVSM